MKFITKFLIFVLIGLATQLEAQNKNSNQRLPKDKPNIIVIYTDDHGYADMGAQGVVKDLKTPNVDALANSGIRATSGYSTAPQCIPSRAGLLSGRFQSKFGIESNGDLKNDHTLLEPQNILPERLKKAGYVTAQFGKWHVGESIDIVKNGFDHVYPQNSAAPFPSNIDKNGNDRPLKVYPTEGYHLETCTSAATAIIKRYKDNPFFLYVAYRAPHVPLDAPKKYINRFPGEMPERRRKALAMLSAVDDGVGQIMTTLREENLLENTLIFYIGDNGAPYKLRKRDAPGNGAGWNGSLNDPLNGEKGSLIEGGMRVPYLVSWKGVLPEGKIYNESLSTLDVAATSVALAGLPEDKKLLDGVNIIPYLNGAIKKAPHKLLTWRWEAQAAIRKGDWKLLVGAGEKEFLYNITKDISEEKNLIDKNPKIANDLRNELTDWSETLQPKGLYTTKEGPWWRFFEFYLNKVKIKDLPANISGQDKKKKKKKN